MSSNAYGKSRGRRSSLKSQRHGVHINRTAPLAVVLARPMRQARIGTAHLAAVSGLSPGFLAEMERPAWLGFELVSQQYSCVTSARSHVVRIVQPSILSPSYPFKDEGFTTRTPECLMLVEASRRRRLVCSLLNTRLPQHMGKLPGQGSRSAENNGRSVNLIIKAIVEFLVAQDVNVNTLRVG